jgi:hypothetical protein
MKQDKMEDKENFRVLSKATESRSDSECLRNKTRRSSGDLVHFHIRSKGGELTSQEQLRDALLAESAFNSSMNHIS